MAGNALAFNTIEIVGLSGALIIILTAILSSSIHRLSTWYLILGSGAVYSFSMLLLAMTHEQTGPEPQFLVCLVQGALIYSSPIWLMSTSFAFAIQFHLTVLYHVEGYAGRIHRDSKWLPFSTVIFFFGFTVVFLVTGIVQPHTVQRNAEQLYCHFTSNIGVYPVSIFGVAFAAGSAVCEFKSGMLLYRHWKYKNDFYHQSNGQVSIGVMIRLASFSLVSMLSVASCTLYIIPSLKNFGDVIVYNAFMSNVDVLILGLNMSIIQAWMFWKKKPATKIAIQVEVEQSQS
ncbi:hypothetical protein J3R30DRAFT_3473931 [Lentinula aciculospora]|uniref:Uncharacterized protein n=1 Tax=Lentinula aciculospora TaxID=153920 RepID=A0A9W9ABL5_9AGAR|nr:hypothetical protein J3R30DRAFT_3473931 [Lentinula aciculospora]